MRDSWCYTGARQVGVEQPGSSSSAPGNMCPYRSSVMPMLAWAMKAESAFALTPGRDHEARVGMARLVEGDRREVGSPPELRRAFVRFRDPMRLTKRPVDGVQVIASAGGTPPGRRRRQSSAAWISSGGRRAGSETANAPAATTADFAARPAGRRQN